MFVYLQDHLIPRGSEKQGDRHELSGDKQKPPSHARLPLKLPSSVQNFLEGWWLLSSEHFLSSGRAVKRRRETGQGQQHRSPSLIPPVQQQHAKWPLWSLRYWGAGGGWVVSLLWGFIQLCRQCCLIFSENIPFSIVQEEFLSSRESLHLDYLNIRGELAFYLNMQMRHLSST